MGEGDGFVFVEHGVGFPGPLLDVLQDKHPVLTGSTRHETHPTVGAELVASRSGH